MKSKPKPATAGEKIEMKRFGLTLAEVRSSGHAVTADCTDAAIRRKVQKERERCLAWASMCAVGSIDTNAMLDGIESGKEQR